jgi:hypothetical protein
MADTLKLNPSPVRPTAPAVAPMVHEQQRGAGLPNRINAGEARPVFPPPQTRVQGAPPVPVYGDAIFPSVPKVRP